MTQAPIDRLREQSMLIGGEMVLEQSSRLSSSREQMSKIVAMMHIGH